MYVLTPLAVLCVQRHCVRTRGWMCDGFALFFGLLVFGLIHAICGRALVSAFATVLCFAGLGFCNVAKERALRGESLTFADVTLLRQVVEHPKLYLPFLPWKAMLAGLFLALPLFWLLANLEYPARSCFDLVPLFFLGLCFVVAKTKLGRVVLRFAKEMIPLTLSTQDLATIGPLACVFWHGLWHVGMQGLSGIRGSCDQPFAEPLWGKGWRKHRYVSKPDIVVIQAESFCDPRVYLAPNDAQSLPENYLATFDAMSKEGALLDFGVHAYGAYTMRTEYEVLTGIPPQDLGTDAFHPYWRVAKRPSWSIAWYLKCLGYTTVLLHPYAKSFFYRDRAIPHLGFDRFVALEDLVDPVYFGPYVSDTFLATLLCQWVGEKPLFCFVITMENHGPWDAARLTFSHPLLAHIPAPIGPYLLHTMHTDSMLATLRTSYPKKLLLALYGDHLPNIPSLIPSNATHTPCLLWGAEVFRSKQGVIAPANLGGILLDAMANEGISEDM
ncbi:MAG: LTA synthase family protein [Desulfovibrio sp.]|nr:LTA synthase family protein [Desulfovibrio sp.]